MVGPQVPRRTSARHAAASAPKPEPPTPRGEPPAKKRRSLNAPVKQVEATRAEDSPAPILPPPPPPLPNKVVDGQPLPTLPQPQSSDLPDDEYQTIMDSGVLSAALKRSREAWTSGSHFTTYWKKSLPANVKKPKDRTPEDIEAIAKNKAIAKTMVKVGDCELTIDPHIFTITLYHDKPSPSQRPVAQYAAPVYPHAPYAPGPYHHGQFQATPASHQHPPPRPQQHPVPAPMHQHSPATYNHGPNVRPPGAPPTPAGTPAPAPTPPPANQGPPPDPVIQMLAHRAGQDPELKAVMKIVATGDATPQQLAYFQKHITELTEILEKQRKKAQAQNPPPQNQLPIPAGPSGTPGGPPGTPSPHPPITQAVQPPTPTPLQPPPQPVAAHPSTYNRGLPPQAPHPHQPQYMPPPPRPPQHFQQPPQPPLVRPPPNPIAVYFDFHEGNGDRFVFPSNTILEFLPGGRQVRASFLITKPSDPSPNAATPANPSTPATPAAKAPTPASDSKEKDKEKEKEKEKDKSDENLPPGTYQPITITLRSDDPRILDCLARAVRPQDEVRGHMERVFDAMQPADEVYLPLRLPFRSVEPPADALAERGRSESTPGAATVEKAGRKGARRSLAG